MNFLMALEIGLREIAAHKFRSGLSMLGIVLGVGSLIATLALTDGIEKGTRAFMEQIGGLESVRVLNKDISNQNFEFWNLSPGRTLLDVEALRAQAPLISHISPELYLPAVVGSEEGKSERRQVRGVFPDSFVVNKHTLTAGRFLTDLDIERATRTAVVGFTIADELWPDVKPSEILGKVVLINDSPFEIVGVLPRYERDIDARARADKRPPRYAGRQGRWDPFREKNESVNIPFSTMFFEFRSGAFPMNSLETVRLDNFTIRIGDLTRFREAIQQARAALDVTHKGVDDYDLETREEWFDRMESSVRATRLSGGIIAAISLFVGSIGIMNIMLASITERVREIGIRMAVGARGRDIFVQILIESMSISFLGGLIGIAASFGLLEVLSAVAPMDNPPVTTLGAIIFSVFFAVLAGFFSGIYPALRASRLNPISALRYE